VAIISDMKDEKMRKRVYSEMCRIGVEACESFTSVLTALLRERAVRK
jgi:hypothetical protein